MLRAEQRHSADSAPTTRQQPVWCWPTPSCAPCVAYRLLLTTHWKQDTSSLAFVAERTTSRTTEPSTGHATAAKVPTYAHAEPLDIPAVSRGGTLP